MMRWEAFVGRKRICFVFLFPFSFSFSFFKEWKRIRMSV